jgi:cell division protein FtsI/penicillin-binding protein 2
MRTRLAGAVVLTLLVAGCALSDGVPPQSTTPPDAPGATTTAAPPGASTTTTSTTPRLSAADRDAVLEVAAEYVSALEAGDWTGVAALADQPAGVADRYEAAWDTLGVEAAEAVIIGDRPDPEQPAVELGVTLTLRSVGDWEFATTLPFTRTASGWRVAWSPSVMHPLLEDGDTVRLQVSWPERAAILDVEGRPLLSNLPIKVIGVVPEQIEDREAVLAVLEAQAGIPPETVVAELERPGVQPDWFLPVGEMRAEAYAAVEFALSLPGILARDGVGRVRADEPLADQLLGRVGPITAEQLAAWGPPYDAGDVVGRAGMELALQEELAGLPEVEVLRVDAAGRVVDILHTSRGEPPEAVRTTLDLEIQVVLEELLDEVELPSAAVVLDVATGGIRAAAARPITEFDRALQGLYPPGSAFKIVTASALLDAGIGPGDDVDCPASVVVEGRQFSNAQDRDLGTVSFGTAFAESCNTTFAALSAAVLDGPGLRAWAERYGFNRDLDLPVPAAGGQFPDPPDTAGLAAAAFGQGEVLASPLLMAALSAAVAGGGWREPLLLADTPLPRQETLDPGIADDLADFMLQTVTVGTGTAAQVEGETVRGKTGSAEFGPGPEFETHAWFTGWWDGLAFAFIVEGGGSGGSVAAPLAGRFVEALVELDS